jgi:hypothetical protein
MSAPLFDGMKILPGISSIQVLMASLIDSSFSHASIGAGNILSACHPGGQTTPMPSRLYLVLECLYPKGHRHLLFVGFNQPFCQGTEASRSVLA